MEIGPLEAEVLGSVQTLKKASARDVLRHLNDGDRSLAYTTVATTLNRLFKKKLLKREHRRYKGGKQYIYYAVVNEQKKRRMVDTSVTKLVDIFGPSVVSTILEKLEDISPEKLMELKAKVAENRRKDADD